MSQTFGPDAQVLNTGSSLQAAPPQSATGTEIPAMSNIAALPFTKEYVSGEQTITAGGLLTLTHGLGVKPKLVTATLVCKTAEAGYSVNDEVCVPVGPIQTDTNLTRGLSVVKSTTSLDVKIAANSFTVMSRTTGTVFGITSVNWRLILRAWA